MSTSIQAKRTQPVTIEFDPARLARGEWCYERGRLIGRGDVQASYSADRICEGKPVRKPFRWQGADWISTGSDDSETEVYRLVDPGLFPEAATSYGRRVANGDAAREDPKGFYHGVTVRCRGREAVLCGPPVTLVAGKKRQLELF